MIKIDSLSIEEIRKGLVAREEVELCRARDGMAVVCCGSGRAMLLGSPALLKVNTNIGVSSFSKEKEEIKKIDILASVPYAPDMMMDHSLIETKKPLWRYMVEGFDGAVGTLPHYLAFDAVSGIDESNLLERIEEMAERGVSFMTLHPTATLDLYDLAKANRAIAITSRGGGVILRDAQINARGKNIIADNYEKIMSIFSKYGIAVSIGTVFRPARVSEALDEVHLSEMEAQKKYINLARAAGVEVIMEGIGHIAYNDIPAYFNLVKKHNAPLMPLGPMPSDATVGFDHVTAAVGAILSDVYGNICAINSVTRDEHTGGVPSSNSILEGLKTARVVAHIANTKRFPDCGKLDDLVSDTRRRQSSCVVSGGLFSGDECVQKIKGCSRCDHLCPLNITR